jgi:hypothetical protein
MHQQIGLSGDDVPRLPVTDFESHTLTIVRR